MPSMDRNTLKLQILLQTPKCVPHIRGIAGVGKTYCMEPIGYHLGYSEVFHMGLAGSDPADINGILVMTNDGVRMFPHRIITKALENKTSLLLVLDEFQSSSEMHMAASQRCTDKSARLGEFKIHDGFRPVLISNPAAVGTNMHALSLPMASRLAQFTWEAASAEEKLSFEIGQSMGDELPPVKLLPRMTHEEWLLARQRATVFFAQYQKTSHYKQNEIDMDGAPPEVMAREPLSYACDRSWSTALDVLATCIHHDQIETFAELVNGIIGPSQGKQFFTTITNNDILDSDEILDGKIVWTPNIKRADQIYAQIASIAMAVPKVRKNSQARFDKAMEICKDLVVNYPGVKHLVRTGLIRITHNPPKGAILGRPMAEWIRDEFQNFAQ